MDELFIEFYRAKDEEVFLDAWFEKYGELKEEQLDELYEMIAAAIDEDVKEGRHELGKVYEYKGIVVGKSDYNEFHKLYIFEQE